MRPADRPPATAGATQRQPAQRLLVRDIQRYVREHLQDELNIDLIGYQFHLSRRHLTRLFKACCDETLVDFTNRTRVETAARLISSSSLSILNVSLAVASTRRPTWRACSSATWAWCPATYASRTEAMAQTFACTTRSA
ncbi:hypothetical protein QNM99_13375 [Pseudomonas sp. PCH446]